MNKFTKSSLQGLIQQSANITTRGFITEWTVSGDSTARTITLPLYNYGTFNCTIDWGDGTALSTITAYDDADRIHTYSTDGTYNVEIIGECPSWSFSWAGDRLKITDIIYWGDSDLFGGFSYLTNAFQGCTNIKTTGDGKIISKSNLVSLTGLFYGCTTLNSINSGLLDNCIYITSMLHGFRSNNIVEIPTDLFKYNTSLQYIRYIFYGCSNLTTIPTDIFKYLTNLIEDALDSVFRLCTSLTTIPTDIFRYNTGVTIMQQIFMDCISLTTIPSNIFKYNTNSTTFGNAFYGCNKLQIRSDIFYNDGEQSTRFLNKSVNFSNCFTRTSFTGTQGIAPDLWNCDFGTGTVTKTNCFDGAGNSLTSISNYTDIPVEWV